MNRTVALLFLLLIVTNLAWMIFSGRPAGPRDLPPTAPTVESPRDGPSPRKEEMAAEIARLEERLARYERPRTAVPAAPAPAEVKRAEAAKAAEQARRERWAAADRQATKWVAGMKQIADPATRARAFEEVRAALSSADEDVALAGLLAVRGSWGVEYDRGSIRPLVLPYLEASDPWLRQYAVYALNATGAGPESIALVLALESDPSVQVVRSLPSVLVRMSGYRPDETTGRTLVRLLSHEERGVREAAIDSMTQVRELTPDLEEALVEMAASKDRRTRERVLFALGRLGTKSDRVIDLLLPFLKADHWNARLVAYRGLDRGVPDSSKRKVADVVVEIAPKFPDHNNLMKCFQILNHCADEAHLPPMERLAANPMLPEAVRKNVENWLRTLRRTIR